MTNAELIEALKMAETNYAYWKKQAERILCSTFSDETQCSYWKKKVIQLQIIFDSRLRKG